MFKINQEVVKKSRKPFQNGKRVGQVAGFCHMELPNKTVPGVILFGCSSPVEVRILTDDSELIALLKDRDENKPDIRK